MERLAKLPAEKRRNLLDALRTLVGLLGAESLDAAPILAEGDISDPPD